MPDFLVAFNQDEDSITIDFCSVSVSSVPGPIVPIGLDSKWRMPGHERGSSAGKTIENKYALFSKNSKCS